MIFFSPIIHACSALWRIIGTGAIDGAVLSTAPEIIPGSSIFLEAMLAGTRRCSLEKWQQGLLVRVPD
jgi:hypothetical protein